MALSGLYRSNVALQAWRFESFPSMTLLARADSHLYYPALTGLVFSEIKRSEQHDQITAMQEMPAH